MSNESRGRRGGDRRRRRRKVLTWSVSGTAFLMVLTIPGCARKDESGGSAHRAPGKSSPTVRGAGSLKIAAADRNSGSSSASGPGAPQSSHGASLKHASESDEVDFAGPPENINVFGEFDGVPPQFGSPASESGFQQHTFPDEGYDGDVGVSPDGKWIVFSSTRHNTKADIYLQRVDGLSVTQLTNDNVDDAFPTFSPDGRRVAFSSTRAGSWDIYLMDVDGRNIVQLTNGPAQDLHPSFAPDGQRVVYCSLGTRSGQWELWTVDLATNQKRMIGLGVFPSWSPDKLRDRIAFQRARARGSRWFSLWTLDLIDEEARSLTEVAVSSNAAIVSPVWSTDGRRIAFSTIMEPAKTKDGKPLGQQDVWVINADGTNRQRLTDGRGINAAPFWGADGRVYFVSDRGGTESIWSASAKSVSAPTMNAAAENGDTSHHPAPQDALASPDSRELEH